MHGKKIIQIIFVLQQFVNFFFCLRFKVQHYIKQHNTVTYTVTVTVIATVIVLLLHSLFKHKL